MSSEEQLPSPSNEYLELAASWGRAEGRGHSSFPEPSLICPGAPCSEQFYCHGPALPEKPGVAQLLFSKDQVAPSFTVNHSWLCEANSK